MSTQQNPMFGRHEAKCVHPECGRGRIIFDEAFSAGYKIGDAVLSGSDPAHGRCPLCKRYSMKVTNIPEVKPLPSPTGFTSIPTK